MRAFCVVAALVAAAPAWAQEQISVPIGGSYLLRLNRVPSTLIVPNENIIRVEPTGGSDRSFTVYGLGGGLTTLTAQDDRGAVFYTAVITVGSPDRIVTIISKPKVNNRKIKGVDQTDIQLSLHEQYTMRCNEFRCQYFTPRNRPLDEDQTPPPQSQPQN